MAIGDLFKATLHFTQEKRGFSSTLHYEQTAGTADLNSYNAACTALFALIDNELTACISTLTQFNRIDWHCVVGDQRIPGSFVSSTANVGTAAGEGLGLHCAQVIRLGTVAPRGQANGRVYISGMTEGQINDGLLTAPALAALNSLGGVLTTNLAGGGLGDVVYTPVVISRVELGEVRPEPIGNAIISGVGQSVVYNQRKRVGSGKSVAY